MLEIQQNIVVAPYTTWGIGGEAEYFFVAKSSKEIVEATTWAKEKSLEFRILGNGSNVLIPDEGLKGLTIINKTRGIEVVESESDTEKFALSNFQEGNFGESEVFGLTSESVNLVNQTTGKASALVQHRHNETGDAKFLAFADLDFEENGEIIQVKFDTGVDIGYAIAWCLKNNISGLQWYAGIPSTMGGALYNNIHGGTHHFSERFYSAQIIGEDGTIKTVFSDFFNFGYDQSTLRENPNIIVLSVTLNLFSGNVERSKFVAMEWLKRKKIQPRKSCGSVFKNLEKVDQIRLNIPTPSAGYVIDKLLGLTGFQVGNMQIPESHGNFIVNLGGGTAKETLEIIKKVQKEALEKLGLVLNTEVHLMK